MSKIRILIVEDSLTIRERLFEILSADPEFEVIGQAADGKKAIELCSELRPDVMALDMMLPVMSGLAVTEYVMAHFPTPILIVSASSNRGELFKTYEALAAGAVDVLDKPLGNESDGAWERKLIAALKIAARIRVITHPRARLRSLGKPAAMQPLLDATNQLRERSVKVVAMGASTGGPGAIVEVLRALPKNFALPIFLVLHIGEPFGAAFADWLDGQTEHRVRYAKQGETVLQARDTVVMAPPNRHLVLRDGRLHLTVDPERHSCRPSVDSLFESIACEFGPNSCACLLTGMGRDGAAGLLQIRRAGGMTIAQDEASSVVYGMPREAVLLGAAEHVLPLNEIGPMLAGLKSSRSEF